MWIPWTFGLTFFVVTVGFVWAARRARGPRLRWLVATGVGPALWLFTATVLLEVYFSFSAFPSARRVDLLWHAVSAAALLPLLVILAPRPVKKSVVLLLGTALGLLALADVLHFRFFDTVLPFESVAGIGNTADIGDSLWELVRPSEWLLLPYGASLAVLAFGWRTFPNRGTKPFHSHLRWTVPLALIAGCLLVLRPAFTDTKEWLESRFSWKVFTKRGATESLGFMQTHARDIGRGLREFADSATTTPEELAAYRRYFSERREARLTPGEDFGIARGKNLIILQIEALQEWVIGAKANGEEITPFLNALRSRAVYYSNVFDQTGSSPSTNCEYAVLNSQHPLLRGAEAFRRTYNDFFALPAVLGQAGYWTESFASTEPSFWNMSAIHKRYGFRQSHFDGDFAPGPRIGMGLADREFLGQTADILAKRAVPKGAPGEVPGDETDAHAPFFAYAVTVSSHHPYRMPSSVKTLKLGALEGTELGDYVHSVRYVDDALKAFFEKLEASGLLDSSVIALYGDHDAKLRFGKDVRAKGAAVLDLPAERLQWLSQRDWRTDRIPLFAVLPGRDELEGTVVDTVGSQVDIAPTLLQFLGVETPVWFLGQRLTNARAGFAVRMNGDFVSDELVSVHGSSGSEDLVNLNEFESVGGCYAFPGSEPLPAERCAAFTERAEEELKYSWMMTLRNLRPALVAAQ